MKTICSPEIEPGYLSAIIGSIDESIVATDKNFVVEFWNKGAEQIFGYTADEVCGRQVSEVFNFIYPLNNREEAREDLLNTGHWRGKIQYKNRQGILLTLDASVTVIKNDLDDIKGYVAVHRNISDLNEVKNELRVLSAVLSSLEDNFFLVDRDSRIVFVDEKTTKKAQNYYGISFSPGDHVYDKLPKEREEQVSNCIRKAFNGQESIYQTLIKNADGKTTWLQGHCMPIRDSLGNVTHCCLIGKDITAQKEIELVNEKLMRSRLLFETFMENSPILSWITDTDGIIRYLNPAYLKTYQLEKEHIGKALHEVFSADNAEVFRENDKLVLSENKTLTAIEKSTTPDGKEHIYQVLKFPIKSENRLYVGGWAIDITEEVRLKDSLNNSLSQLRQSEKELKEMLVKEQHLNDLKGRFVSMASHEFRTPLSTMLTSAFLLEKYTSIEDQSKRQKHTNKIKESIQHLNFLLEDFLSLGKLEEGKTIANFSHFDLNELVEDVMEELEPLKKTGQNLEYRHTGDEEVHTDKKLLKNILINLLTNAYKFSAEFKNIWLSCNVNQNLLCITVRDEGIGISQNDQAHLFETFFRGHNALNIQGTGLGLHIIKRYATLLGGSISIESELDFGTTVRLELPV